MGHLKLSRGPHIGFGVFYAEYFICRQFRRQYVLNPLVPISVIRFGFILNMLPTYCVEEKRSKPLYSKFLSLMIKQTRYGLHNVFLWSGVTEWRCSVPSVPSVQGSHFSSEDYTLEKAKERALGQTKWCRNVRRPSDTIDHHIEVVLYLKKLLQNVCYMYMYVPCIQ